MTAPTLPGFGSTRRCPKCGWEGSTLRHVTAGSSSDEPREHIVRTCTVCSFARRELPLDASPQPPAHSFRREPSPQAPKGARAKGGAS